MEDHEICRMNLSLFRTDARSLGVEIPKHLVAIRATKKLYFIEDKDGKVREYVKGCCSWSAKANYIDKLISAKERRIGDAFNSRIDNKI